MDKNPIELKSSTSFTTAGSLLLSGFVEINLHRDIQTDKNLWVPFNSQWLQSPLDIDDQLLKSSAVNLLRSLKERRFILSQAVANMDVLKKSGSLSFQDFQKITQIYGMTSQESATLYNVIKHQNKEESDDFIHRFLMKDIVVQTIHGYTRIEQDLNHIINNLHLYSAKEKTIKFYALFLEHPAFFSHWVGATEFKAIQRLIANAHQKHCFWDIPLTDYRVPLCQPISPIQANTKTLLTARATISLGTGDLSDAYSAIQLYKDDVNDRFSLFQHTTETLNAMAPIQSARPTVHANLSKPQTVKFSPTKPLNVKESTRNNSAYELKLGNFSSFMPSTFQSSKNQRTSLAKTIAERFNLAITNLNGKIDNPNFNQKTKYQNHLLRLQKYVQWIKDNKLSDALLQDLDNAHKTPQTPNNPSIGLLKKIRKIMIALDAEQQRNPSCEIDSKKDAPAFLHGVAGYEGAIEPVVFNGTTYEKPVIHIKPSHSVEITQSGKSNIAVYGDTRRS